MTESQNILNCTKCDLSLVGSRYIMNDEKAFCVDCYEQHFSNQCELCKERITCDSKDLSFRDKHWHEKCFFCNLCRTSLVDKPFSIKNDELFCPDCHDERFSPRCAGCEKVFKAGARKYEYKGASWHEECFICSECQQPIGTKSFVPRNETVVCIPCYEEKFCEKCFKCAKPIQRGGVSYKNQPWHKSCFLCSNCSIELAGQKFTSRDDKPYCSDCFSELFAKRCAKCTKPISGIGGCKFITFEEKHWHSECFVCEKCSVNLVGKGFLVVDNEVACVECANK